ncbi:hypothetical protein BN946_scf185043.g110 [Trametes cinnabarina]|uniref:HIG1 domain-containing protein n=1 Tax=Pycnoporus cinnabarinus TaxID=5643 RepID=A0A060SI16_PYCCI|nr:hypothetical protein BN946_scf185043.g110 [Trametes cinnabarina]
MNRVRRQEEVDRAYEVQAKAAIRGAAQYGAVGLGLAAIGHYSWPAFRRQTLPFKAWLVTIVSVFGLCIHAENALQSHELEQRRRENTIRREARLDLARRGLVATETEIAKWKEEHFAQKQAEAEAEARARTESSAAAEQPATTASAPASEQ